MLLLLMNKISCLIKVTHKIKNNLKIKKHIGVEKHVALFFLTIFDYTSNFHPFLITRIELPILCGKDKSASKTTPAYKYYWNWIIQRTSDFFLTVVQELCETPSRAEHNIHHSKLRNLPEKNELH